LFNSGRKQAVRIPREFEPGEEAVMRKEGERLIIEPRPVQVAARSAGHPHV
jgi:antitoxin VapB